MRNLTRGKCKELEHFVSNVRGRIPVFGYPMLCYSPPNSGFEISDKRVWRASVLQDGQIVDNAGPEDLKQISYNIKNSKIPSSSVTETTKTAIFNRDSRNKSPAGALRYLIEENNDFQDQYRSKWG